MEIGLTLKELRRKGFVRLEYIQQDSNLRSLEGDLILLHTLKIEGAGREYLIAHGSEKASQDIIATYSELLDRRSLGEPLSYILNKKEFYGREFFVDKRVLIPRPETELLVEISLKRIISQNIPVNIIDIGTGSGCITISLISELIKLERIDLIHQSIATDISEDALRVAKINSSRLLPMKNIPRFIKSDLLPNEIVADLSPDYPLLILANLPYIDQVDPDTCDYVRQYEPQSALFSEDEGLGLIFTLLAQVFKSLEFKNNQIVVMLEIGHKQANRIEFEAKKIGIKSVIIHPDLSGKDRIVECHF